jgi:hypothetical protein
MNLKLLIFSFIMIIALLSCKSEDEGFKGSEVTINTKGIFQPVTFYFVEADEDGDLGEFEIGQGVSNYTIYVKNNSNYPLTSASLFVDDYSSASMKFVPDDEGKSESPGVGGTCNPTIQANEVCEYKIQYNPTIGGYLSQDFVFTYRNLVEENTLETSVTLLTGAAASLIFTNDETTYSYGVQERTERLIYSKSLEIKNAGGLTARDINIGNFPAPNSGAYNLTNNTCGTELKSGELCTFDMEWEPQNYDAGSPDGAMELSYTNTTTFTYIRTPLGGTGSLNAYFDVLSTTIEARIRHGGLDTFAYNSLVVGNTANKTIKITNKGYKEGIIHSLDVRDAAGLVIAKCVKAMPGTDLECRDPLDANNPSAVLTLDQLPFKFIDTNNCIDEYSKMNYTRNPDGSLSDPSIVQLAGKTNGAPGDSCFLDVTFHPSLKYLSDGDWANTQIIFVFDSTWKNNIVMFNQAQVDAQNFTITSAPYMSAGILTFSEMDYNSNIMPKLCEFTKLACAGSDCVGVVDPNGSSTGSTAGDLYHDTATDLCYSYTGTGSNWTPLDHVSHLYDLGRVALISSATYAQPLSFEIKNEGGYYVEISSVVDGATPTAFNVTGSPVDINDYYRGVSHAVCTTVEKGQKCAVSMDLAPLAGTLGDSILNETYENNQMYDTLNAYPDRYKEFTVTYTDGALYEDDMSPHLPKTLKISMRSLLVRKGYLVFEYDGAAQGDVQGLTTGDEEYFHLKIKNVGTGKIPYISGVSGFSLEGTAEKAAGTPYPYEIVPRPLGPEALANKDCSGFFFWDEIDPNTPAHLALLPGQIAADELPAGEVLAANQSCSLTVKFKYRNNDRIMDYNENTSSSNNQFNRFFDLNATDDDVNSTFDNRTREGWEFSGSSALQLITFQYYDGDGQADLANEYDPEKPGYGNYYQISGGTAGDYTVNVQFNNPAKLVPGGPSPSFSGVLYKPSITTTDIVPAAPDWGSTLTGTTIPAQFMYLQIAADLAPPANYIPQSKLHIVNPAAGLPDLSTQEYTYHAGTFKANTGAYSYGFKIYNKGGKTAKNVVIDASGLPAQISYIGLANPADIGTSGLYPLIFDFTPETAITVPTIYSGIVKFSYDNGSRILVDPLVSPIDPSVSSPDYVARTIDIEILVIFEAVPSTDGDITLTSQTYDVVYDPIVPLNPLPAVGPNNPTEGALTASVPVDLLFNKTEPGFTDTYKAIKGSPIYVKKLYTLQNTGGTTMNDLKFAIKTSFASTNTSNTTPGAGYSVLYNNCTGSTPLNLAVGATCTFEIKYLASAAEKATRDVIGSITYAINTEQYISKLWTINFQANTPATVELGDVIPSNLTISDDVKPDFIIENAWPIKLGFYNDANHPVLNDFPIENVQVLNIPVVNASLTKASFLKQYRIYMSDPIALPPPDTGWIVIHDVAGKMIEANRGCFFGDDEFGGGDPNTWGFNSVTGLTCKLRLTYDLDDLNIGEDLPADQNYIKLTYYDNDRNSSSSMFVYITGFIEPNQSTVTNTNNNISNVTSTPNGDVYFEWNASNSGNASWGGIDGYRVFYDANETLLLNIFLDSGIAYQDTVTESITVNSLNVSKLYYFKIVAKRTSPNGKQYLSDIVNMPIYKIFVPPTGTFYDYPNQIIVDRFMAPDGAPENGTKSETKAICATEKMYLSVGGSTKTLPKKLINSTIFAIIDSDHDGFSDYPYEYYRHWMDDSPITIAPLFPGYSCDQTSGHDVLDNEFFQKTCNDCSCDSLSVLRGGGGRFIPLGAILYSEAEVNSGAARCYVDVSAY